MQQRNTSTSFKEVRDYELLDRVKPLGVVSLIESEARNQLCAFLKPNSPQAAIDSVRVALTKARPDMSIIISVTKVARPRKRTVPSTKKKK
jgi:hypothetical protein